MGYIRLKKTPWNKSMKSNSRGEEHRYTIPKEYNYGNLFPVYTDWEVANRYRLLNSVGQQVYFAQEGKCELWGIFCLWWRHGFETISALLALCVGNPPDTSGFPHKGPVMRSFDMFFVVGLNNLLNSLAAGHLRRRAVHMTSL